MGGRRLWYAGRPTEELCRRIVWWIVSTLIVSSKNVKRHFGTKKNRMTKKLKEIPKIQCRCSISTKHTNALS